MHAAVLHSAFSWLQDFENKQTNNTQIMIIFLRFSPLQFMLLTMNILKTNTSKEERGEER